MLTNHTLLNQILRLARLGQCRVGDHRRVGYVLGSTPTQCQDHGAMQLTNQPSPDGRRLKLSRLDRARVDADRGHRWPAAPPDIEILRNHTSWCQNR